MQSWRQKHDRIKEIRAPPGPFEAGSSSHVPLNIKGKRMDVPNVIVMLMDNAGYGGRDYEGANQRAAGWVEDPQPQVLPSK
jgi:hypothetical protein